MKMRGDDFLYRHLPNSLNYSASGSRFFLRWPFKKLFLISQPSVPSPPPSFSSTDTFVHTTNTHPIILDGCSDFTVILDTSFGIWKLYTHMKISSVTVTLLSILNEK